MLLVWELNSLPCWSIFNHAADAQDRRSASHVAGDPTSLGRLCAVISGAKPNESIYNLLQARLLTLTHLSFRFIDYNSSLDFLYDLTPNIVGFHQFSQPCFVLAS